MIRTVLVVDDVPSIRELMEDALSSKTYRVLTAASAEAALEVLKHHRADVVISDEKMPGMTGTEFLSRVRKRYPETVRIILTGHATLDAAIRAINEGEIYRFLTKPCNLVDLTVTIRQALAQKDLERENRRLTAIVKQQAASLHALERHHPGITQVKRDRGGAVIIEDGDQGQE